MFVKLAIVSCLLGITLAQQQPYQGPLAGGQPASLYPAGVNPQSCPNYPDCSNPLVAISQNAAPQYQPQQYQPQQYNAPPQYQQYQPAATTPAPVSQYNPVYPQQYSQPAQGQYSADVQQRLDRGEYIGDGDYRGEGLAEALAPGYTAQSQAAPQYAPVQSFQPQQYAAAPQYAQSAPSYPQQPQPAQIPAGVNAQACPNYPFCHA